MSRAWQASIFDERLGEARPGALLTSAGAVPIGLAVLIAAGLLPWGARLALAAALVVLGVRIRGHDRTSLGARIRPATARALGTALLVGGGVLAVAALGVALDGGRLESQLSFDDSDPKFGLATVAGGPYGFFAILSPTLDGWAGVVAGGLLVALGALLAREARPADVGVVVGGVGAAIALIALTGGDALGLGPDLRASVTLVLAIGGAALVARRPDDAAPRALGVAAGLLLALVIGEGTGLVSLTLAGGIGPPFLSPTREGAVAAVLAVGLAVAAVMFVTAVRLRDVVVGVLPAGVLLLIHPIDGAAGEIGVLLVPVALVAVALAALTGVEPVGRVIPRAAAPAALAVAVLVLLVGLTGAFGVPSLVVDDGSGGGGVRGGQLAAAIACAVVFAGLVLAARRSSGSAATVTALVVLVGLHIVHPLVQLVAAAPDSFLAGPVFAVLLPLGELALGGAVVVRGRPEPVVLAAAGLLVVSVLQSVGLGLAASVEGISVELVAILTLLPSVAVIAGAATYALVGPAPDVLRAQAFAIGAAVGSLLFGSFGTSALAFAGDSDGAILDGGGAVLALAIVAVAGLGVALLAASTGRRASSTIATATIGVTVVLATFVATVAASVADAGGEDVRSAAFPAIQSFLGFDDAGSLLQRAPDGWPVVLAVVGAVLLAAAVWLESRRPLPADAPLG